MQERLREGESLFAQGKLNEAKEIFSCLLHDDPNNAGALNNLGVLSYFQNYVQEAESYFLRAVAAKEDYLDPLLNLSKVYQQSERWQEAADQLEKCLSITNEDSSVRSQLEAIYGKLGRNEKNREVPPNCNGENAGERDHGESVRGGAEANTTSCFSGSEEQGSKVAMQKQALIKVIKKICYHPHPGVRRGGLFLNQEIFNTEDRETNVVISPRARIDLTGDVTIGPWVMIGEATTIFTHDHYHGGRGKPLLKVQEEKGVAWVNKKIGSDVWLHGCTVLAQVTAIPEGVVVGAGSVLTKNPGPYEIWAGNPAKKVGER